LFYSIAIFQAAPLSMAGTVGAIFNGALQCGSAVGLSVITSLEASVEATHGGSQEYAGRAAAFWFLLAVVALEFISVSIFYDRSTDHKPQPTHGEPMDVVLHNIDNTQSDEKLDVNLNSCVSMPVVNIKPEADQVGGAP
jgi:hypothetical protein